MKNWHIAVFTITTFLCANPIVVSGASPDDDTITFMNQLKRAMESHKTVTGSYYDFVSSPRGAPLVEEINRRGGVPIIINTSASSFCFMKELSSGESYCMDNNSNNAQIGGHCSSTNISCRVIEAPRDHYAELRKMIIEKIRALLKERRSTD
jgi:hypothetical protein